MKTRTLIILALAAFLTSCAVTKTSTSKTIDVYGSGVIQKPVIAELEVKTTKITGTSSGDDNVEIIKHDAVTDALKKANADVLVEPMFETVTTNGHTTANVSGFPGNYKNFRPITEEDISLLKVGVVQKADVYEAPKVKKSHAGAIFGIVGGSIAAALLLILLIAS